MNQVRYLLDNNALVALSTEQRSCDFVRATCQIPSEVLYEARGLQDAQELRTLEYPLSGRVLEHLQNVMRQVPLEDHSLVDLYRNKGTADPILIACALDAIDVSRSTLFPEDWVIVSDDGAVCAMAEHFGIPTESSTTFVQHL